MSAHIDVCVCVGLLRFPLYIYALVYEGVREKGDCLRRAVGYCSAEDRYSVLPPLHLYLRRVGAVTVSERVIFDDLRGSAPKIPD